jgi:hypothetical protein
MSLRRKLAIGAGLTVLLALLAWQPVSRFLFHPDGVSLAAGVICMENASGVAVIAEISVVEGAKTIEYLGVGEKVCSPSSRSNATGMIRVSMAEARPPFCEIAAETGTNQKLKRFAPPHNCEWQA